MYAKTPRLVRAKNIGNVYIIVYNCTSCVSAKAGWDTLVRSGHRILRSVDLYARRVIDKIELFSVQIDGIQLLLLGDWLTNSNSVRRAGHNNRQLSSACWASFLARGYFTGKWLSQFAVLWTILRFLHVDRRRSKGMTPLSPLYQKLPAFLALYRDLPPFEGLRAFIQMSDEHFWSRQAMLAAAVAIEETGKPHPEVQALIEEARESKGSRFTLSTQFGGKPGHHFIYEWLLTIDRELAAIIFGGISVKLPMIRPRRVHGHWSGSPPPKSGAGTKLFKLLHHLEMNSFIEKTNRYNNK